MTLAHLLPRWALHRSMLIWIVSFAGFIASGAASGSTTKSVTETCSGGGQRCNNVATVQLPSSALAASERLDSLPGP
jgi:hypothetical protein